ncbi:MAG: dihydrodipicolinate synthase family protein [Anaerolineales bacterium]|nr:dihydrodipicolinate synthase family protein [Anaerolineales bacterium]
MTPPPFWITGIVPAVFTPMLSNGDLNLSMIPLIVDQLIEDGASALYVCGSTGEGASLTREERMAVAETYVHSARGRLPIIVQVGHDSLREAQQLASHAQSVGANAISATPPAYFKLDRLELLIDCLSEICAAAPALPFYYYHIPRLTAARFDMVELLRLSASRLPGLQGVKYSDFTIFELQACVDLEGGRFNILFGSDEMLLAGLAGGAQGAVGTTYSFATPLYRRILNAFRRREMDKAQHLQSLSVQMVRALNRYAVAATNLPAMKAMMKLIGLDCGPLRLPLPSLAPHEAAALGKEMESIGFFEWARN